MRKAIVAASMLLGVACSGSDRDPEYLPLPPPCEAGTDATVSGAIGVSGHGAIAFDGAELQLSASHKRDVDAVEAGCVGQLMVRVGAYEGCTLELSFGAGIGDGVGLQSAVLTVGSLCPGFLDAEEGIYDAPEGPMLAWFDGLAPVADGAAERACVAGATVSFAGVPPFVLRRHDGAGLTVDLSGLTISGHVETIGDTSSHFACPSALRCPDGHHDGGDGWCVPLDACSAGFHDGGRGACVPVGTCEPGLGVAGDGTCRVSVVIAPAVARSDCAAVSLSDGSVLVAGGWSPRSVDPATASTERLLPGAFGFSAADALPAPRAEFTLTPLAGGGALAVGGFGYPDPTTPWAGDALASAERWDEAAGEWVATAPMATKRIHHGAVRMADGRVLVVGGSNYDAMDPLDSTELWSPATGTWSPGPALPARVYHPKLALLNDGRVLAVGSFSAAVLAADASAWTMVTPPYSAHTDAPVATLPDGRVLRAAGGAAHAQIFDPATGAWGWVGTGGDDAYLPTVTVLPAGRVLVVSEAPALFDPATGTWTDVPEVGGRAGHCAAALGDGRVLLVGGYEPDNATAELYLGAL